MKNGIDAKAAEWVAREDRGALSPEETAERDAWLSADTRHLGAYARMRAIMLRCERLYRGEQATDRRVARPAWRPGRWPLRIAAALAAVALTLGTWTYLDRTAGTHSTRLGEVLRVPLEDGSIITMNTDTRVRVSFDAHGRNIELLRGEAMFDVAKDKQRPFTVKAGDARVVAVGTSFQVRRSSHAVSVLVQEGIVKVSEGNARTMQLLANDKAWMPERSRPLVSRVDRAEVNRALAWRDGMIAFNGQSMEDVSREFARYSPIRIRIDDPQVARLRVIGLFSATDPIGFSRAAAQSMGLEVSQSESEILIRKSGEKK